MCIIGSVALEQQEVALVAEVRLSAVRYCTVSAQKSTLE